MRYKGFRTFRFEPVGARFSLYYIIPYRLGLPNCPASSPRASGRSVPSVCRPYQRQSKARLQIHSRCSALPFLVFEIFARWTLNLQTHCAAGVARGCASRYALRCRIQRGPSSCKSCMPCKMSYVFTAQLLSLLLLGYVRVVSLGFMVTACNSFGFPHPPSCFRPQAGKLLAAPSTPAICVIASNRPQLLTVFRRFASLRCHHLVGGGIFHQYLRIIATLWRSTGKHAA